MFEVYEALAAALLGRITVEEALDLAGVDQ